MTIDRGFTIPSLWICKLRYNTKVFHFRLVYNKVINCFIALRRHHRSSKADSCLLRTGHDPCLLRLRRGGKMTIIDIHRGSTRSGS